MDPQSDARILSFKWLVKRVLLAQVAAAIVFMLLLMGVVGGFPDDSLVLLEVVVASVTAGMFLSLPFFRKLFSRPIGGHVLAFSPVLSFNQQSLAVWAWIYWIAWLIQLGFAVLMLAVPVGGVAGFVVSIIVFIASFWFMYSRAFRGTFGKHGRTYALVLKAV